MTEKNIEPVLITDKEDLDILEELQKLELLFHHPEFGTKREEFEKLVDESFWEVGASGNRYNRNIVLDVLEERTKNPIKGKWEAEDFYCSKIAGNNYLLTYTLHQGERVTRRSAIWRKYGSQWKTIYHQGTIVEKSKT